MTTHATRPRVKARDLLAAATRLAGAVVLDLADLAVGPARYEARLAAWSSLDAPRDEAGDLGTDDGSLIVLVLPGTAGDLIAEHGTAGRAAQAVTRELRAAGVL